MKVSKNSLLSLRFPIWVHQYSTWKAKSKYLCIKNYWIFKKILLCNRNCRICIALFRWLNFTASCIISTPPLSKINLCKSSKVAQLPKCKSNVCETCFFLLLANCNVHWNRLIEKNHLSFDLLTKLFSLIVIFFIYLTFAIFELLMHCSKLITYKVLQIIFPSDFQNDLPTCSWALVTYQQKPVYF